MKSCYLKKAHTKTAPEFAVKNEFENATLLLVDFVFWKKVKTPKRNFEIN